MRKVFVIKAIAILCVFSFFTLQLVATPLLTVDESVSPALQKEKVRALETFSKLDESNNYTDHLTIADLNVLPMGMSRTISNVNYAIAVSSVRFFSDYAELSVFGRVTIPQIKGDGKPQVLFFAAQNIKLSFDGNVIGDAELALLGDINIPINGNTAALILKGAQDLNTGRGLNLTYLKIDCKGFKELGITAEVVLPETLVRKVNADGNYNPQDGRVTGSFQTIVKDWSDILVAINLPSFEIVGLNGFIFTIEDAMFDFSDLRNDTDINFSSSYQNNYMIEGNPHLWRGIYVRNLSVALPKQFASRSSDKRISFSAQNMIIDNNGVTGRFSATNLLSFEQGSAGGWKFSLNNFSIDFEANQLLGAGFAGNIGIPIGENTSLVYSAFISPNNEYFLRVNPEKSLNFDIWKAKAEILPNSYVELKVVDDKFLPEALLNGSLSIAASMGGNNDNSTIATVNGVIFRGLHLKTTTPKLSVEYLGYNGEVKLMNFPLSISNIGLTTNSNEARLGFDAKLNLGENKFEIGAQTHLEVVGTIADNKGLQTWTYKTIDIRQINIDAKLAEVFSIKGGLTILNNDPTYGNGFAGNIELKVDKVLKGLTANARAIFGNKGFRYWLVDGKVEFGGNGIPVFAPFNLNGFGGGAYYKMRPSGAIGTGMPTNTAYIPDDNYGLGLKAAVLFNVAKDNMVNGEAQFEIAFNKNGGINFIGFFGQAKVLSTIKMIDSSSLGTNITKMDEFVTRKFAKINELEQQFTKNNSALIDQLTKYKLYQPTTAAEMTYASDEKVSNAGLAATVGIQYDFTNNSLHANLDLYINVLGGMMRGIQANNKAGSAILHIDPNEWYMHIGTPTNRLGVQFNLANFVSMQTGTYLMIGDNIPGSPPPPQEVANILGLDLRQLDYMRNLNDLESGKGFAFGSNFKVSTGDITFMMLYANFQAGLGFDIMLKDYGDAQCKGRSGPIGIDGWYANGQAYAYLQGELGVKVNLLFVKKRIPILKGAAAALLQAKLPNPAWFAGYLGVKFEVLGGLIKGSHRLKITLGEECELVIPGGSPLGVRVISDISPENKATNVDVFSAPQAAFTMPIGKEMEMESDDGVMRKYKLNLEELTVSDKGKALAGKIEWNSNKDAVSFYSHEILPPNTSLKVLARITFEEYQGGRWVTVYTSGVKAEEKMEIAFTTGTAPDIIPMHNIELCYPIVNHRFFYKGEYTKGYVQLKRGQSYLFSTDMTHQVHVIKNDGTTDKMSFTYNSSNNRLEYSMPNIDLGSAYTFNLLTLSKGNNASTQAVTETRQAVGDADSDITVRSTQAAQVVRSDAGKSLLSYNFTTSKYATLKEKMDKTQRDQPIWWSDVSSSDVVYFLHSLKDAEGFDVAELQGNEYTANVPLVQPIAALDDNYYKQTIYPLLYKTYPIKGISITNRNTAELGLPPAKALPLITQYTQEVASGNFNNLTKRMFPYIYDLPRWYKSDFINLQYQAVNKYLNNPTGIEHLITGYYPFIPQGYYKIKLNYVLPGNIKGSEATFDFYNSIR